MSSKKIYNYKKSMINMNRRIKFIAFSIFLMLFLSAFAFAQNETGTPKEEEGISGLFKLVAVVFIFAVVIALVLLIFKGLWKWVRFLFFSSKNKEEPEDDDSKRKLSAIMFTDMKGYSAEMGRDEERTIKKAWRYERAIRSIIKEHHGRVVKTIGDAIMGDFDSAVNAVRSAAAIQDFLKKEDIKIRIGIHLGDVVHKAGDIFGEGVNIASRLESICEPGSTYISEDVYNQVKGKVPIKFESLGSKPLKNIESPPKVYKISGHK